MVIGLGTLAFGGVFIYVLWKSFKSKLDLGIPFLLYLSDQTLLILTALCFILGIGETLIISGFHPEGDLNYVSPIARTIGHLGTFLVSYIFLIISPKEFAKAFSLMNLMGLFSKKSREIHGKYLKDNNITYFTIIATWVTAVATLVIGLTAPLLNVYIMAWSVDQAAQVNLLVKSLFTPDMTEYYTHVLRANIGESKISADAEFLPANYSPFADMVYPLQILIINATLLVVVTIFKGFKIITSGLFVSERTKFQSKEENKDKKKEDKSKVLSSISQILEAIGYAKSSNSYKKYFDSLKSAFEKLAEEDEAASQTVSGLIGQLFGRLKTMKSESTIVSDHDDFDVWVEDVIVMFRKRPSRAEGLGINIKNPST